jgi:hypothetical protein
LIYSRKKAFALTLQRYKTFKYFDGFFPAFHRPFSGFRRKQLAATNHWLAPGGQKSGHRAADDLFF